MYFRTNETNISLTYLDLQQRYSVHSMSSKQIAKIIVVNLYDKEYLC